MPKFALTPRSFAATPSPKSGGGVISENDCDAVPKHRITFVFGIHPPFQTGRGVGGMGEMVYST